jgi:hypothetical protein
MRIRSLLFNVMRIHADPDPQHWSTQYTATRYPVPNALNLKGTKTEKGDNISRPGEEVSLTHL